MFKGTKKAIARTPHNLLGHKTEEDEVILNWKNDFENAEKAMQIISKEVERFISNWNDSLSYQKTTVESFISIYEDSVQEHNKYRLPQETPRSVINTLNEYQATLDAVVEQSKPVVDGMKESAASKCNKCKECISIIRKALTKRDHKKQDFDRHYNTVEKLIKKSETHELSNREQSQLTKAEDDLESAKGLFENHDYKVRTYIPHVLSSLSEFLNLLSATVSSTEFKIVHILQDELHDFCQRFGFSDQDVNTIISQWHERINPEIHKIDSFETRKVNPQGGDKSHLISASEITHSIEHVVTTTFSPKDIKFSSQESGIFLPLNDPLPELEEDYRQTHHDHTVFDEDNKKRPTSSIFSNITVPFPSGNNHRDSSSASTMTESNNHHRAESDNNRIRGLSSSSARALSLEYKLPESSEYGTAIYSFPGYEPGDVAFKVGDKIKILDHGDEIDKCWWFGQSMDGRIGLFPYNYIKINDTNDDD